MNVPDSRTPGAAGSATGARVPVADPGHLAEQRHLLDPADRAFTSLAPRSAAPGGAR
jgi:hypothetical protein